jgi:hypothetical protein
VDLLVHTVPQLLVSGCGYEIDHTVPCLWDHDLLGERSKGLGHSVTEMQDTAQALLIWRRLEIAAVLVQSLALPIVLWGPRIGWQNWSLLVDRLRIHDQTTVAADLVGVVTWGVGLLVRLHEIVTALPNENLWGWTDLRLLDVHSRLLVVGHAL